MVLTLRLKNQVSKLVAVQGCTFTYETTPSGSVSLATTIVPPSSKVLAKGNRAHTEKITINVASGSVNLDTLPSNVNNPGVVPAGTIRIDATAQKADSLGKPFVLKGDNGSASFVCTFPMSVEPYSTTISVTIKATVDDTNQDVLKVT